MWMIIVTWLAVTGAPIEQVHYFAVPQFENEAACKAELASENFKPAMADLQKQVDKAVGKNPTLAGGSIKAACVPSDTKPLHP
jgi:hypothetical protein